jgi:type IV secretion system protein VirD4
MTLVLISIGVWLTLFSLWMWGLGRLWRWLKGAPAPNATFGSAHFMTVQEKRDSGLYTEKAGVVLGRDGPQTLRDAGEGHVLVVGPSRSGKGTTHVLPTLREWPYDLICLDPKGENYESTGAWRASKGAIVHCFDPMGTSCPTPINLLASIRLGTDDALADADVLARSLLDDAPADTAASQYYRREAVSILAACLLHTAVHEPQNTLGGALRFMTSAESHTARLKRLVESDHPAVQAMASQLLHVDEKTRAPLWSAATSALSLWRDSRIEANTSTHGFKLASFQTGEQPITLYLRSPESQLERLAPLMRTVIQVIINRRMEAIPDRFRRPCLFLLDEFNSLGSCFALTNHLSRMAGYRLRLAFIVQDLNDLTRLYGPHANLTQNCATRMFHTPNDLTTARYCAALLGTQTVEYLAERETTSGLSTSHSEGVHPAARGLMTVDEVLRLPPSNVLIFASGQAPLMASKIPWDDPTYRRVI